MTMNGCFATHTHDKVEKNSSACTAGADFVGMSLLLQVQKLACVTASVSRHYNLTTPAAFRHVRPASYTR